VFSPLETKVLEILGKGTMTIGEITTAIYYRKLKPFEANNTVARAVRRINEKCKFHKLSWFLNSNGRGRGGKSVWRDK
jgi:hypothetical protein